VALKLDILANTREFVTEMKKAGASAEDIEDALDELKRQGVKDIEALEKPMRDLGKKAKDTGDDISKGVGKGLDDVKSESASTAKEAAASFDGSAESIADAFQEVAANAFAGFGPAGAIAGLAAAAGIGLAVAGFTANDEAAQASKERVAEWADSYVEAGGRALTAGVQAARFQDIITDPEAFQEAERNARLWGVSTETAIAAMSGNKGAIDDVRSSIKQLGDEIDTTTREGGVDIDPAGKVAAQTALVEAAKQSFGRLTGEMAAGQSRAQLLNGYYADLINTTSGVVKEVDELGNELYTLPDETQILVDAKTGQATQNVNNFKGDVDGIPETVTTRVVLDDSAVRGYRPPTIYIPGRIVPNGVRQVG
jgi:hypothetical protein